MILRKVPGDQFVDFNLDSGSWRRLDKSPPEESAGSLFPMIGGNIAVWSEDDGTTWIWWRGNRKKLSDAGLVLSAKDFGLLVLLSIESNAGSARFAEWCPKRVSHMLRDFATYDGIDDIGRSMTFSLIEIWKVSRPPASGTQREGAPAPSNH